MRTLDIILLIPLIFGAYKGYKKGLLLEVIGIFALFLAVILGFKLLDWGIGLWAEYSEDYNKFIPYIAFLVIFIGTLLLLNLVGTILKRALDFTPFGMVDNAAGAMIGFVKWAFAMSLFFWFAANLDVQVPQDMAKGTYIYPLILTFAPSLIDIFTSLLPFTRQFIDSVKSLIFRELP